MTKRMLVDATHGEETRVAVVNGNRLEELDFEFASRKQLKGNIYLAKVIRVEPSLQAAFVEYGGNRHGFLAFSEIHPDYYRIPVEDRAALLAEEERLEAAEARRWDAMAEAEERAAARAAARSSAPAPAALAPAEQVSEPAAPVFPPPVAVADVVDEFGLIDALELDAPAAAPVEAAAEDVAMGDAAPVSAAPVSAAPVSADDDAAPAQAGDVDGEVGEAFDEAADVTEPADAPAALDGEVIPPGDVDEDFDVVGGDEVDEGPQRRARPLRSYKIQEVIKRRQILLVQVTKEERGNKGAALTTYLSLPGRYCVLMPNTGRGGGISRKITNPADRRRLKDILSDLDIPGGMAVILRTAGLERAKPEIRRDLEYLLRLWDDIREQTMKSVAPTLIYEEANLIKRAIRDVYADDIEEVWVDGEAGFRTAQNFMRMMMPSHTSRVQLYKDSAAPLFHRYQVEQQIDAIHSPVVQLRSGGYIVINPTEALVAIDVNSGRSTRERNIEETAFKTNLEAADEVARQLRLRDLAGLIVIDFIDMEDSRNNMAVERRLKEAMKNDRARIQVGRISSFGLMELSRQRLRPSLQETNFERCPHCDGAGVVRSVESAALHVLRAIADEGVRRRAAEILVYVPTRVALYLLNQKRADLSRIETRYGFRVAVANDDSLIGSEVLRIERMRARSLDEDSGALVSAERVLEETDRELAAADEDVGETVNDAVGDDAADAAAGDGGVDGAGRRRRRRRRRGGRDGRDDGREGLSADEAEAEADDETAAEPGAEDADGEADGETAGDDGAVEANGGDNGDAGGERRGRRRRGRRGGRRERGMDEGGEALAAEAGETGPAPIIRAVLPAAESVAPLAAIDFDLILEGEEPVAPAPEIIITAPVAVEEVAVDVTVAETADVTETETETETEPAAEAPAKPARKRKTKAKAGEEAVDAAPATADGADGEAAAKPARKRKTKAKAGEEAVDAAPATADGEAAAKPARKRKTKAKAGEEAVDAAPAAAEAVEETAAVETPTVVEAPVDAAPADAAEAAPADAAEAAAEAAKAAENLAARAAEKVNLPPEEPKRGWWRR